MVNVKRLSFRAMWVSESEESNRSGRDGSAHSFSNEREFEEVLKNLFCEMHFLKG